MSWLEFIAAVIGHVAVPATVIAVLLIFRRPIENILPKIRRAKWGDRELEFGDEAERVREKVEQLPGTHSEIKALPAQAPDELVAGTPPPLAVMNQYNLVEEEALALARAAGLEGLAAQRTTRGVFDLLVKEGIIDRATFDALMDLRRLRNVAAHKANQEITEADALEYAEAARTLRARLAWIRERLERMRPAAPLQ